MIAVENFDWEIRAKQMVAAYQNLSLAERTIFPKECVITYQKSILPASEQAIIPSFRRERGDKRYRYHISVLVVAVVY